jgi:hypothetical protein
MISTIQFFRGWHFLRWDFFERDFVAFCCFSDFLSLFQIADRRDRRSHKEAIECACLLVHSRISFLLLILIVFCCFFADWRSQQKALPELFKARSTSYSTTISTMLTTSCKTGSMSWSWLSAVSSPRGQSWFWWGPCIPAFSLVLSLSLTYVLFTFACYDPDFIYSRH